MTKVKDIYTKCDELDNLPRINKENYLFETDYLAKKLPKNAKILQVGSMDGNRIIDLYSLREDLIITGMDIDKDLIGLAEKNIIKANVKAKFIYGDITKEQELERFDYVLCLNNTLGYIPGVQKAVENMKKAGQKTIISVYGEKFNDELAQEYFHKIGLQLDHIQNNIIHLKDFTKVKRFTKQDVMSWTNNVIETPLGYLCTLQ